MSPRVSCCSLSVFLFWGKPTIIPGVFLCVVGIMNVVAVMLSEVYDAPPPKAAAAAKPTSLAASDSFIDGIIQVAKHTRAI